MTSFPTHHMVKITYTIILKYKLFNWTKEVSYRQISWQCSPSHFHITTRILEMFWCCWAHLPAPHRFRSTGTKILLRSTVKWRRVLCARDLRLYLCVWWRPSELILPLLVDGFTLAAGLAAFVPVVPWDTFISKEKYTVSAHITSRCRLKTSSTLEWSVLQGESQHAAFRLRNKVITHSSSRNTHFRPSLHLAWVKWTHFPILREM